MNRATRYFAVFKNDWIGEYINFNDIKQSKDKIRFLVEDQFSHLTKSGGWRISKYTLYTPEVKPLKYHRNEWCIENLLVSHVNSQKIEFNLEVSDPNKEIRRKSKEVWEYRRNELNLTDIKALLNVIEYFHEISNYENWRQYELHSELKRLETENQSLKNQIKVLEEQLENKN